MNIALVPRYAVKPGVVLRPDGEAKHAIDRYELEVDEALHATTGTRPDGYDCKVSEGDDTRTVSLVNPKTGATCVATVTQDGTLMVRRFTPPNTTGLDTYTRDSQDPHYLDQQQLVTSQDRSALPPGQNKNLTFKQVTVYGSGLAEITENKQLRKVEEAQVAVTA